MRPVTHGLLLCGLTLTLSCSGSGDSSGTGDAAEARAAAEAEAAADPAYLKHKQEFSRLYSAGDYNAALVEAIAALETAPVLEEPYTWTSSLHTELGRDLKGKQYFERASQRTPDLPWPWFYRGYHEWHLGQLEEALASFRKAAELDPANPRNFYRQGVVLHRLGDFEEAVRVLRRAHELDGTSTDTAALLADVLRFTGDYAGAEAIADEGLRSADDSAKLHHTRGQLLLRRGDDAGAEAELRRTLELDAAHPKAHQDLSRLLFRSGREAEALREKALADRSSDYERGKRELGTLFATTGEPRAQILLAELELTERRYRDAFLLFRRATESTGGSERILAGQVSALFGGGEIANAKRGLTRLAKVDTGRADLARAAGSIADGDPAAAENWIDRAVARGGGDREFLRRAGDLYAAIGKAGKAEEIYERATGAPRLLAEMSRQ